MPAIKLNFNISAEKTPLYESSLQIYASKHQNILSQKTHYIEWITWSCRLCEVSGNAELLKSFTMFLKKDSSFHVNLYFCKEHFIKRQHSGQVSRQRIFYCTGSRPRKVWKGKWLPSSIVLKSNFLTLTDRPTFRTQKGAWPIVRKVQSLRQISSSLLMHTVNLK